MAWTNPASTIMDLPNGAKVYEGTFDAICGNFSDIGGTTGLDWINWTPTVDQGGAVAVTVNEAQYVKLRTTCFVKARLTAAGVGTSGSAVKVQGMPAAITPVSSTITAAVGAGAIYSGGLLWAGTVAPPISSSTALQLLINGYASTRGTTAYSLAVGNTISYSAM